MGEQVTAAELLELSRQEMEYRKKLLDKYSNVLTRSEGRVDNINKMIGDLLRLQTMCSERLTKEQDNVTQMISLLHQKDLRIEKLEEELNEARNRYYTLLEKTIHASGKVNENVFNLK